MKGFIKEYIYLITLAIAITLIVLGTKASAKVVVGHLPVPDGLKTFVAV